MERDKLTKNGRLQLARLSPNPRSLRQEEARRGVTWKLSIHVLCVDRAETSLGLSPSLPTQIFILGEGVGTGRGGLHEGRWGGSYMHGIEADAHEQDQENSRGSDQKSTPHTEPEVSEETPSG